MGSFNQSLGYSGPVFLAHQVKKGRKRRVIGQLLLNIETNRKI